MNQIVTITPGGEPVTTSLAIAEGVGNPHKAVIQLVRQYQADLEDFGLVAFEMSPRSEGQHGGGDVTYATLNEPQATLLMTYMRNNDVVRAFKKRLVRAFYDMATDARGQIDADLDDPVKLRELLLHYTNRMIGLAAKSDRNAAYRMIVYRMSHTEGSLTITEAAKVLKVKPRLLFGVLDAHGYIYRKGNKSPWSASQKAIDAGELEMTIRQVTYRDGSRTMVPQVRVTMSGLTIFASLLNIEEAKLLN